MTYFPDLSPYEYTESQPAMLNVGWLDEIHPYVTGAAPEGLVEALAVLGTGAENIQRGMHFCELCPDFQTARDNTSRGDLFIASGEIRVAGDGVVYASPVMIVHYVEAHAYVPPDEYCRAVMAAVMVD
ncbi:DUF7919 family protein [Streptomyces sp. NBC_00690]|uniref:DUF7919 family protein n=1 Tax=Streptomyces sp. NBC_00690 TaxID=2975808 RepID=UPI002E2A81A1|nr:hypothetical protein [Streptomyces sp. NBC_00690]